MKNILALVVISLILPYSIFAQFPGGVSATLSNQLWLDASQQVANDGANITSWSDASGNGNNAAQTIGYKKPKYRTNGINGMPAVDFDGIDDYLYTGSNSNFNSNQSTHFVVYERSTVNAGSNCLFNMDFNEASNLIFTSTSTNNSQIYVKNSLGQPQRLYFGTSVNNILSSVWDGSAGTLTGFLNGSQKGPKATVSNTATGHNLCRVGAFNTNFKFNGNMGEVIYYTSILNSAERNIVENYLSAKYQIPVAQDLYGHELTHRFDVIGVGQEADGSNNSASGTTNIDIVAYPALMNDGDYVMVGHDDGGFGNNTVDVPNGYSRYNQVWRSTVTNYGGTVDISFDVSTLGLGNDTSYKLLVDADGVFASGAVEYTGLFFGGTVFFPGVTLTSTSFFTLSNSDFAVISTGVTNDWHLTTTWNCGCIPSLGSDVTILPGHNVFINGQNAQANSLTIDGSLSFNATDTLTLNKDLTNNNVITPGLGTFNFSGSTFAQAITGSTEMFNVIVDNALGLTINNSLGVQGWLDVVSGSLTTNNALTLLSNSSGTGAFKNPKAGKLVGNYTVERFLNEGESWYLLAPVVSGGNLEDWNQEAEMQGFTGTEWPGGISSVYYYDQNNIVSFQNEGYSVPTSTFDILDPKVGYEIYIGDDTKATGARTIDMTGTPVVGNVSYACPHIVKIGNPASDGYSLITNPYPAPVRWGTVTKSANFDVAYRKLTNGSQTVILNSWLIASGEAFWVHSNVGGTTIDFQNWMAGFNEDITDNYNLKTISSSEDPVMNIKLSYTYNSVIEENYAYLGFSEDATDLKDSGIDAYKLNNFYGDKPNLSTTNDNNKMEVNILSKYNTSIIPINIVTETPSSLMKNYSLSFENLEDILKNNKVLVLEDRDLGIFTNLTQDTTYSFTMMDSVTQARFFIHTSSPLVTSSSDISCYGANDGKLKVDGYSNDSKNYIWKDGLNNVISSTLGANSADSILNLLPGSYSVEVTNINTSEVVVNTFKINEPGDISANFYSMSNLNDNVEISFTDQNDTLLAYINEPITFDNSSENTSVYSWNFDDLTSSSLENPTHIYFNTGLFKVELTAGNGNCNKLVEKYVNVVGATGIIENNLLSNFNVFVSDNFLNLTFDDSFIGDADINISNNLGQIVYNSAINIGLNHKESIYLDNASGIYFVTVNNDKGSKTKKIVYSNK